MKRFFLRGFIAISVAALFVAAVSFTAPEVLAQTQDTLGLTDVGQTVKLGSADPRVIAVRIINVVLGLVGIILLGLMLYAGYTWMTSGGDEGKITTAKKTMLNAVIGLVIVLSSWAITSFVMRSLLDATGGNGGSSGTGGGSGGGGLGGGGGSQLFQLDGITPSGSVPLRNVVVRVSFTQNIDPASASIAVTKTSDQTAVDGQWSYAGQVATFVPNAACPDPNATLNCFDESTEYTVRVGSGTKSTSGASITCGGFAPICTASFTTGALVDTQDPTASIIQPTPFTVYQQADTASITVSAKDDSGISLAELSIDGVVVASGAFAGSQPNADSSRQFMVALGGFSSGNHTLTAKVYDLDSHSVVTQGVPITIRPAHCANGQKDGDETAIDCGGSCGACSGQSCTNNQECASGACINNVCVDAPIIESMSPADGRPGTIVTLRGRGFGTAPGQVKFANGVVASPAQACLSTGAQVWSNTMVLVEVPETAVTGVVELNHATNGLKDTTTDALGPVVGTFTVNTEAHPALCQILPDSGMSGDQIRAKGVGFGTTAGTLKLGDRIVSTVQSWSDSEIVFNAPVFTPATYPILVETNGQASNALTLRIDERTASSAPVIRSISPDKGPKSQYITIQGSGFGSGVGKVFVKRADGASTLADTQFPAACGTGFWSDTSIMVKVPSTIRAGLGDEAITPGNYTVEVQRSDAQSSAPYGFEITNGTPTPGICAILPATGPVGTSVEIIGEGFGSTGDATFSGANTSRVNASIAQGQWSEQAVKTSVPAGAITGNVQISSNGQNSNTAPFAVMSCKDDPAICGAGESCCASGACSVGGVCAASQNASHFAWNISTGQIPMYPYVVEECSEWAPSPSPWVQTYGTKKACVNAMVGIRFSTHMDPSTITSNNIQILRCIGTGEDPCETLGEPIPFLDGFPWVHWFNDQQDYIQIAPSTKTFAENSKYAVKITTGVKSMTGDALAEKPECGPGYGYCFNFETRSATDLCIIDSIKVLPETHEMKQLNETQEYGVIGVPRDEQCLVMSWYGFENLGISWTTTDGRASITTNPNPYYPSTEEFFQTATGLADTGDQPVGIKLDIALEGKVYTDTAELYIKTQPPVIVNVGPNCDAACTNAAVWAEFSTPIDETSLQGAFRVQRCTNENCTSFDRVWDSSDLQSPILSTVPGSTDTALRFAKINMVDGSGQTLLEKGRFYRVLVRGGSLTGVRSVDGLMLSDLNDPDGYVWNFRIKDAEDATCGVSSVDVAPMKKIETVVGAKQVFSASPKSAPDACSKLGQILSDNQSYNWTIQQTGTVSGFINGGNGQSNGTGIIDTSLSVPAGCTSRCIEKGASGVVGKVAACGNRIVETKNGAYCRNSTGSGPCAVGGQQCKTIFGDVCTLLAADAKGGEECDEGSDTGACSNRCLWKPSLSASCGNGIIERGEQCDPGTNGAPGCTADCQALGANAGGSSCGNNDIAAGETCDDGNGNSGDGCSAACLNEGSGPVVAVCGNGVIEAGESCEKTSATWPIATCNPLTCLATGTAQCGSAGSNCCGNGIVEAGETCDDGNATANDGCSISCLREGSSVLYQVPSFCGDGVVGRGESGVCESTGGDGLVDGVQMAEIIGNATPDSSGLMSSVIQASVSQKTGSAQYGLQCGYTSESSCAAGYGLDKNGCCAIRPDDQQHSPTPGATGVCRNTAISVTFNTILDKATVEKNFFVAEKIVGSTCPAGLQYITTQAEPTTRLGKAWQSFKMFFGMPAKADVYCAGSVSGKIASVDSAGRTKVILEISQALKPNTVYRVWINGDTNLGDNPQNKVGILSERGVVSSGNQTWIFTTGASICTISTIRVKDTNLDSPALFTAAQESHQYIAEAISIQAGQTTQLSSVSEYSWVWQPFNSSEDDVLAVATNSTIPTQATVTAQTKSGTSFITGEVKITADTVQTPSTANTMIRGSLLSTALLCHTPWPARDLGAFADVEGSLAPGIASGSVFYNFSTLYCRDGASRESADDDLPAMRAVAVERTNAEISQGVLRQYLLSFDSVQYPELAGDGIGIRVMSNPLHLSIREWYASRGFTGSPKSIAVDGYEALDDGSTFYISAGNTKALANEKIYANVYIISRNPDAKPVTTDIFKQLVEQFTLNANLQDDIQNVCVYGVPDANHALSETYRENGSKVVCHADWECLKKGTNLRCASFKSKLQRDLSRIADFSRLTNTLEETKETSGTYPALATGSFIQGMSTSRWPSWSSVFPNNIADPVNRYMSCGFCSQSQSACLFDTDCFTGETCKPPTGQDGLEASTCWNTLSKRYTCPVLSTAQPQASVSHIYQYRSLNGGQQFELGTELESADPARFEPPLRSQAKACTNIDSTCVTDADCTVRNYQTNAIVSEGQCLGVGGTWKYRGICTGVEYGQDEVCGNGVIGTNELCEIGDTQGALCTTADGKQGTKLRVCRNCTEFVDSSNSTCVAQSMCGNGRVDVAQCLGGEGKKYGLACQTPGSVSECVSAGDPVGTSIVCTGFAVAEQCDDGAALNGTYGHCNRSCTGYDNYCGDYRISAGETCDLGEGNGNYCGANCDLSQTCNATCNGVAPSCGDGKIDSGETCDGNLETTKEGCTPRSFCTVKNAQGDYVTCMTNADCSVVGGTCATYETQKTRSCKPKGDANQCTFESWTNIACQPTGSCGDGVTDTGEECDDGNASSADACTTSCKKNICGDSIKNPSAEECDYGAQNGGACPTGAEYGSNCLSCTNQCKLVAQSGGYCGNGRIDANSPEQCDGSVFRDADVSCKKLGYDFAKQLNPINGTDAISCNTSCQYTGCARCSEAVGTGTLSGQIFDAVYSFAPVPNARITLYSRGIRMSETFADKDGKFTFTNIVTQSACSSYKIVVDMYKDNLCTGTAGRPASGCNATPWLTGVPAVDEGAENGYWPYESKTFDAANFWTNGIQNTQGKIFLIPRVKDGETLVVHTWKGAYSYHDMHLVVPIAQSFKIKTTPTPQLNSAPYVFGSYEFCAYGSSGCGRDVHYGASTQGNPDMQVVPHANLYCYSGSGANISLNCSSFSTAPQTLRYKNDVQSTGKYGLFLVDYSSKSNSYETFGEQVSGAVRVVTSQNVFTVEAPVLASPPCTDASGKSGKYWYVFSQQADTDVIDVKNTYHCTGDQNPNNDTTLPLPMTSTGS